MSVMTLSREQKQELHDDGYVVVHALVPDEQIRNARRAINQSFGRGIDPERIAEFESRSFCPELRENSIIHDLLLTNKTLDIVEDLIGPNAVDQNDIHPQMAIRFPSLSDEVRPPSPHLDGMYTPTNGLEPGDIWSHTLLVGIFLTDVVEPNAGNFTAWPGSHHRYEKYFRDHGPESLLNGMPTIDIGEPRQVMARAGDVLLAHYELGHTNGPHVGVDPRYAVFFRVSHPQHGQQKWDAMTNIWLEWPGMTEIVAERQQ
jgi:hypothetical protein